MAGNENSAMLKRSARLGLWHVWLIGVVVQESDVEIITCEQRALCQVCLVEPA
jgi:hypothetical protein